MRILLNIPLSLRLSLFNVNQEKDKKKISLQLRYDDNIVNVNYVQMKWIIKRNNSLMVGNERIERKNS